MIFLMLLSLLLLALVLTRYGSELCQRVALIAIVAIVVYGALMAARGG